MCRSEWTWGKEVRGRRATSATSHTHRVFLFFYYYYFHPRRRSLSLALISSAPEPRTYPPPTPHSPFPPFYHHSSVFCENFPEVMHKARRPGGSTFFEALIGSRGPQRSVTCFPFKRSPAKRRVSFFFFVFFPFFLTYLLNCFH